jgi:hypothetical protein
MPLFEKIKGLKPEVVASCRKLLSAAITLFLEAFSGWHCLQ